MSGSLKLLCDTNVWLDNYLSFRPGHESAVEFFTMAAEADAMLLVPLIALKDFYYLLQVELKRFQDLDGMTGADGASNNNQAAIRQIADASLDSVVEIATVVPADASDVWLARKQRVLHDDFEDDLVIAAAVRAKADFLVTSDRRLIAHAPVAALSPEDMVAHVRSLESP